MIQLDYWVTFGIEIKITFLRNTIRSNVKYRSIIEFDSKQELF